MGDMENIAILLALAIAAWLLVSPILVISLHGRVRRIEERLREAEREMKSLADRPSDDSGNAPGGSASGTKSAIEWEKRRARKEAEKGAGDPVVIKKGPPSLPVPVGVETAEKDPRAPLLPAERIPAGPQVVSVAKGVGVDQLLEKMGLKPPHAGAEGTNLMAWWSTRIGLILGVIAAVFFGLYVNQNTVPWVRLIELIATSLLVFGLGWRLERKLGGFGRALSAGGLALLYVSAYAAYGLPAMKVIDSPWLGAGVQIIAVALMSAWALWRRNEGVFGLALALGYVTSWFTLQEGVDPLPLVSLLVLVTAGATLFAWRGWWSGLWAGIGGSGGGLIILTLLKWVPEGGPSPVIALGSALLFTLILVVALFLRAGKESDMVARVVPIATSVGLLVGVVIVGLLEIEWEWFYAGFAILLLLVGFAWKGRASGERVWGVMWIKASVLIALYLIARFEGPVRAFALLGQAGSLIWLGQNRRWLAFEVGGLLAALTGWFYLTTRWPQGLVANLGRDEIDGLAYLLISFCLVAWASRGATKRKEREITTSILGLLIAIGGVVVGVWRVNHDWALLVGLAGGLALWRIADFAKMKWNEAAGVVGFLGTIFWLATRVGSDLPVGWQSLVWLVPAWGFCVILGRAPGLFQRAVSVVIMLASVAAVWMAGDEFVAWEWMAVIMISLAILWQGLDGFSLVRDLRDLSTVPALVGTVLSLGAWNAELCNAVLAGLLGVTLVFWVHGWFLDRNRPRDGEYRAFSFCRGMVLGVVTLLTLQMRLEGAMLALALVVLSLGMIALWRKLQEEPLAWIGLAAMVFAAAIVLDDGRSRDHWHEVTVASVFLGSVINGLVLGRSGSGGLPGNARVASVLWATFAMGSVLLGLVLTGESAGWTTAFWAVGAVALLAAGFWGGLRGYRVIALGGLGCALVRLFAVDVQDTLWRIVAFGVTSGLLIGIGYVYNRYHKRLAEGDLDWGTATLPPGPRRPR